MSPCDLMKSKIGSCGIICTPYCCLMMSHNRCRSFCGVSVNPLFMYVVLMYSQSISVFFLRVGSVVPNVSSSCSLTHAVATSVDDLCSFLCVCMRVSMVTYSPVVASAVYILRLSVPLHLLTRCVSISSHTYASSGMGVSSMKFVSVATSCLSMGLTDGMCMNSLRTSGMISGYLRCSLVPVICTALLNIFLFSAPLPF